MRYADTLLSQGEVIVYRARQHWLALILESRAAVVLWVIGIALLLAVMLLNLEGQGAQLASIGALICLGIGLIIFLYRAWQWWAQDYMITNRRLMKVTGILNKRSSGSSLEKINDAILDQNVLGRILNYGDLDILTAAGESAVDYFRMLAGAKEFKRVMLDQKHALEMEAVYGRAPSPPLRAPGPQSSNMNGERLEPAARPETPAPEAETFEATPAPSMEEEVERTPMATESDASLEVTQTLARLADLRDRGAISEADYEAKKQELLGRL